MTELCRVFADLAADPENAAAVAAARARLVDLVWHVPGCDTCSVISEAMPFPERVFAVLGEENLDISPEELKEIRAQGVLSTDDRNAIPDAVEFLLAGLPGPLGGGWAGRAGIAAVDPLHIFDSIDAVNQLVRRVAGRIPRAKIEMSSGGVRINGAPVSSRATVIAEIVRLAGVSETLAQSLWSWQVQAAEYCPTLYPDLVITNAANGALEVALEKPSPTRDLVVRWKVRPLRSKNQLLDLLAELKDAVAAATRVLVGVKQLGLEPELGRFVTEITTQNATIAEMVDAEDEDFGPSEDGSSAIGRVTDRPTVLAYLLGVERKKQRCLKAIANAPEGAAKLRKFAAESQVVAGRNIIELQKLVKA